MQPDILLHCIKLVLGGLAAFLAIVLWSKTREAAWVALIAGVLSAYAGIVFEFLVSVGVTFPATGHSFGEIAGLPPLILIFTIIPRLFFIAALIFAILHHKS